MKAKIILIASAAFAALFVGCKNAQNPIEQQTPQQTQAAYNIPMQTDAAGGTQKHTATRNFNNTGAITYQLLPNGAMVPVMTWGQGINSDFAANAVNGASVKQGQPVPISMNGQQFQGPFGQGATINAIDKSNAENMPEQIAASMGGQNDRIGKVTELVIADYEGQALVAEANWSGMAVIGGQIKDLAGTVGQILSPPYAAVVNGKDVVLQAAEFVTSDGKTVTGKAILEE